MKRFISAILLGLLTASAACAQPGEAGIKLDTDDARIGYALGLSIGQNVKSDNIKLDINAVVSGLRDGLGEDPPAMTPEQIQKAMTDYQTKIQTVAKAEFEKMAKANKAESDAFLKKNSQEKGVKVTDSGLQYIVLKEGTGASPKATDTVQAHYHGTLIDGTVFDSSVERGTPIELPLNRVIDGWSEALQLMKVGSKWKIALPPEIAYGENPMPGGPIGPNQVLVFELELLGISGQEEAKELPAKE